jgi:hypothetical protein
MRPLLFPFFLTLFALLAAPAASQTRHDEQVWLNVTVTGGIGDRAVYFAEIQPRFGEGAKQVNQRILRGAIGWRLTPSLNLSQGYGRITNPVGGGPDQVEDRSFQQIDWRIARPFGGDLSSRTRLEQRWRSDGNDLAWRLTEMLRLEVPLQATQPAISALLRAEGFFALNDADWGVKSGFDQARGFVGLEIPAMGKSTFEVGYLNQTVNQTGGRIRMNHVASLALIIRP